MSENMSCSFCKATTFQVKHLIKGNNAYICDECVDQCLGIIEDLQSAKDRKAMKKILTPQLIVEHLDQHVIGQHQAKKLLAIAVYNHYKRITQKLDVEIQKSNILLIGPTGCGKTHLVTHLAHLFDVPYAIGDATTLTEAGYVGDDVDMILGRLVVNAGGDINKAQKGIVYLDEVDKIARSDSHGKDVRGEGVQQALLKMIEGGVVTVNPQGGKKGPTTPSQDIDTTNILFIFGGAFSGLTDKINRKKNVLGFGDSQGKASANADKITAKDLIKYGLIPEFIGRIPVLAQLEPLKESHLVQILTEPKNSLTKQYKALFGLDGVNVTFDEAFLKAVASKASAEGTGARGLRAIMEECLSDAMFNIPTQKPKNLVITNEFIKEQASSTEKPATIGIG